MRTSNAFSARSCRCSACRPRVAEDTAGLFTLRPSPLRAEATETTFPFPCPRVLNGLSRLWEPAWDLTHHSTAYSTPHLMVQLPLCHLYPNHPTRSVNSLQEGDVTAGRGQRWRRGSDDSLIFWTQNSYSNKYECNAVFEETRG